METKAILLLVKKLEDNTMVENNDRLWEAMVVLAVKPHQERAPWDDLQWGLCVLYRKLNQVTRPFAFPIPRCNNTIDGFNPSTRIFIAINTDLGYWQVVAKEDLQAKLVFIIPGGKKQWKVLSLGALKSAPTSVAMMLDLQENWRPKQRKGSGRL
eukprot:4785473-Ditylum_brightwellii.AAC.1